MVSVQYARRHLRYDTVVCNSTLPWYRIVNRAHPTSTPGPGAWWRVRSTWQGRVVEVTVLGSFAKGGRGGVWVCGCVVWVLLLMPGQRRRALLVL